MSDHADQAQGAGRPATARHLGRTLLGVSVAASLALTACAGPTEGAGDETITIGAALSLTGNLASSAAHSQKAYELWVEEKNKEGGLLGQNIELSVYDDQSDPATATRLYSRLITSDNVDLLIGPFGSAASAAAATVAERNKMPMLLPLAASDAIFERGYRYVFQAITPASNYYNGALELGAEAGYQTVGCVGQDYEAARVVCDTLNGGQAEEYGLTSVHTEYYPIDTTDYSSLIRQLMARSPDIVICTCYADEVVEIAGTMRELDYMPKLFVSNGAAQPEFLAGAGPNAEGHFVSTQYEPQIESTGNAEFVELYTNKFGTPPSYYEAFSWAALEVLAEAVETVGSLDQEQIRDEIAAMTTETVVGKFDVDETGKQLAIQSLIVQIQNGERVVVWPEEHVQGDAAVKLPMELARR